MGRCLSKKFNKTHYLSVILCSITSYLQEGCVKKMQGSTLDLTSHLPDNVIQEILMRMPIQDAVRTSVLSRRWRNAWATLPHLVFDDAFYRNSMRTQSDVLVRIIYQVLLLHCGAITKFKLSLSKLASCSEIDQVILLASNNGIQEFILHIKRGECYKLPCSFFSCLQLKHLELHFCLFRPPLRFKGFSKLLYLELQEVSISSKVFSSLISSCPLLEKLKLVRCGFGDLEITAPKLTSLYFKGAFDSICIKNAPSLARVTIYLCGLMAMEKQISDWVTLFTGLPVIEFLQLESGILELIPAGGVPRRLPIDLCHLKTLTLYDIDLEDEDEVSSILCLIRSSPNLEKLTIWANSDEIPEDHPVLRLLEGQHWWDLSLAQLREVKLELESGTGFELELIKVILTTSPVLEKMVIELNSLSDPQRERLLEEVTQIWHLSPLAKVSYV